MYGEQAGTIGFSFPRSGGAGKVVAAPFDEVTSENVDPVTTQLVLLSAGKEIENERLTTTEDGKQLTFTGRRVDPQARMIKHVWVYDRQ